MTNIGLLVIDTQNKYKSLITNKMKQNMVKVLETFNEKKLPIFFTQWSRCKHKHNCTRNHKKETMTNKLIFMKNDLIEHKKEQTRKYKCPSKKCDIIFPLKKYSKRSNTFVSDNFDSFVNKQLCKEIKKAKIDKLYIIGGWASHCVISTALSCIHYHNIMPFLIEDAIFDKNKSMEKVIPLMIKSIIPGCKVKDLEIE